MKVGGRGYGPPSTRTPWTKGGTAISKALLVRKSFASKIGPIPATYSEPATCPIYCPWRRNGCYARCNLQVLSAWKRAARGLTIWRLIDELADLPDGSLFRWGIAGDLPGDGRRINLTEVLALARSVKRLKAWSYTHYLTPPAGESVSDFTAGKTWWNWGWTNREAVVATQAAGLTVNLSADNPRQADEMADLGIAPVVTVLQSNARRKVFTPAGRPIRVCPASLTKKVTCANCGFCAVNSPDRKIVGFPAHGIQRRYVDEKVRESA